MKFQIVEFNDPTNNTKVFSVRMGTIVLEHWFWCFNRRKIVWQWDSKGAEYAPNTYKSFSEAQEVVENLKAQLPIYYNVK